MNTAQNYVGGGFYANSPTAIPSDGRQVVNYTTRQQIQILDWLHQAGRLTKPQYQFGELVPILDDGMAPQLCVGGSVVMQWIDRDDNLTLRLGKVVALRLHEELDPDDGHHIGRLIRVNESEIVLAQDNEAFAQLVFDRQQVGIVYDVVIGFDIPVL